MQRSKKAGCTFRGICEIVRAAWFCPPHPRARRANLSADLCLHLFSTSACTTPLIALQRQVKDGRCYALAPCQAHARQTLARVVLAAGVGSETTMAQQHIANGAMVEALAHFLSESLSHHEILHTELAVDPPALWEGQRERVGL